MNGNSTALLPSLLPHHSRWQTKTPSWLLKNNNPNYSDPLAHMHIIFKIRAPACDLPVAELWKWVGRIGKRARSRAAALARCPRTTRNERGIHSIIPWWSEWASAAAVSRFRYRALSVEREPCHDSRSVIAISVAQSRSQLEMLWGKNGIKKYQGVRRSLLLALKRSQRAQPEMSALLVRGRRFSGVKNCLSVQIKSC